MLVAQFKPDLNETNLARGFVVPRGSRAARPARQGRSDRVRVPHRARRHAVAARDRRRRVLLLRAGPAASAAAGCGPQSKGACASSSGRRPASTSTSWRRPAAPLPRRRRRGRLQALRACDRRPGGRPGRAGGEALAVARVPARCADRARRLRRRRRRCCRSACAMFQGYRLLQEYFSFPQRFLFVDVTGLASAVRRQPAAELELVLLFERGDPVLEKRGRRLELRAVLHAGDQPLRKACGPHPRDRRRPTSSTSCRTARARWTSRSSRSPR